MMWSYFGISAMRWLNSSTAPKKSGPVIYATPEVSRIGGLPSTERSLFVSISEKLTRMWLDFAMYKMAEYTTPRIMATVRSKTTVASIVTRNWLMPDLNLWRKI